MGRTKDNSEDRRRTLAHSLLSASQDGSWRPGDLLPTVRELSEKYQVSSRVVNHELRKLIDQGIVYTVPRVGTFVGRPSAVEPDFYLLVGLQYLPEGSALRFEQLRIGFEERVAQLGGVSLALPIDVALDLRARGELPPLAGVFDTSFGPNVSLFWHTEPGVALATFATANTPNLVRDVDNTDMVFFDDFDGGMQATYHLLQQGHQRIAFLGLHCADETDGMFIWSARRAAGWREVLARVGQPAEDILFLPETEPSSPAEELATGTRLARNILERRDITAVVAANDNAALGLCEALRKAKVPSVRWPSIIGFDERSEARNYVLTSVRLPWEDVGRCGADLLYERKHKVLTGAPQERQVKMKLVARMTARRHWSSNAERVIEVALTA